MLGNHESRSRQFQLEGPGSGYSRRSNCVPPNAESTCLDIHEHQGRLAPRIDRKCLCTHLYVSLLPLVNYSFPLLPLPLQLQLYIYIYMYILQNKVQIQIQHFKDGTIIMNQISKPRMKRVRALIT